MAALAVGLVFDLLGSHARRSGDPPDFEREYEPESTVQVLEAAVRRLGHRPLRLGSPHELLALLGKGERPAVDLVWNIAEGRRGRNREAWAPVLLEMAEIPCLGSDALTLSLTLDKAWAAQIVAAAGVPTPPQRALARLDEVRDFAFPASYPLIVKPRWEGTSKGIRPSSRVENGEQLEREVARILRDYAQPALVESLLEGPEYTVTLIGNDPPRALPVLQRALETTTRLGLHAFEALPAPAGGWGFETPGALTPGLEARLAALGRRAFDALGCRDFARADFKLSRDGEIYFLEMNPLPTFALDSSFAILAELEGRALDDLLAEILGLGLARLGLA